MVVARTASMGRAMMSSQLAILLAVACSGKTAAPGDNGSGGSAQSVTDSSTVSGGVGGAGTTTETGGRGGIDEGGSGVGTGGAPAGGGSTCQAGAGGEEGDGCSCTGVWKGSSVGFTYQASGGLQSLPGEDAECFGAQVTFEFLATARALSERGCITNRPVDRTLQMSDAELEAVLATMRTLSTTCVRGCVADIGDQSLTVRDDDAGTRSFISNFRAGCGGNPQVPLIQDNELSSLEGVLGRIMSHCDASNRSDVGVATGACTTSLDAGR